MAFRLVFLFRRLCVCLYWVQPEISFILLLKGLYWGGSVSFPVSNFFLPESLFFVRFRTSFFAHSFAFICLQVVGVGLQCMCFPLL